ncbi:putative cytochrome P450 hydroxylase [Alloactinosynnema sp. L-07]|uniref:cytochrome P450 n=1 Tax=Alloactinosynnema sp. L-07 TaxID=1653480 RepID=UPI00065F0A2E|nr:cytochrome P450 [Alloactinosynnema sp. L-07]CRK56741.1 putative cytochrome P450 hydroxylase [Alloactinosynnema sp. L-07]
MATRAATWTDPPADEAGVVAWLREMCDSGSIRHDPNGDWHIFGYADVLDALSNHAAFSNAVVGPPPEDSPMNLYRTGNLSWMDPPRHRQLRALVNRVFTPRYVAGLEPMVIATVEEFLDKIRSADRIAYVEEYAAPVVSTVIARMVGIPPGGTRLFRQWSKDLMALADPETTNDGLQTVFTNTQVIGLYLREFIQKRRRDPRDDLTSGLIAAEVDGERLDDAEIAGLIAHLLATGQAATLTLVNAVICLDQHPAATARLRSDPTLLGTTVEEVMRFRNQTTRLTRRTVEDVSIGGHVIPAGQSVSIWLAAANRDPRAFPDPDTFDIERAPNPHLALGHGIHYCLGTSLARMEIGIALDRLLRETRHFSVDYATSRLLDPRQMFGANEISLRVDWLDPR